MRHDVGAGLTESMAMMLAPTATELPLCRCPQALEAEAEAERAEMWAPGRVAALGLAAALAAAGIKSVAFPEMPEEVMRQRRNLEVEREIKFIFAGERARWEGGGQINAGTPHHSEFHRH